MVTEPHCEVRELLERVVTRLGHEPVNADVRAEDDFPDADVLLLEPAPPEALAFAQALRRSRPEIPIVCASICPPSPDMMALDPVVYLLKPFALAELERALETAIASAHATSLYA